MRVIYTVFFYLAMPAIMLRLVWRGFRAPAYWQRWWQRWALFSKPAGRSRYSKVIWLHAVSLGESQAAAPLLKKLLEKFPDSLLVVTTTTPTGSANVVKTFGSSVFHVYAPYDMPGSIRRFLQKIQPSLAIIMETELWPNWLYYCKKSGIPVLLANARLSARSAARYGRFATLTRHMLGDVTTIVAQSESDAQRFIKLGATADKVKVGGNIKFDIMPSATMQEKGLELRRELAEGRPVWIAASTHDGEDEQILAALAQIRKEIPEILLILVPRHPERFAKVAQLCRKQNYTVAQRSRNESCTAKTAVYLGDTMGELTLLYAASDVAFIGGSLVPTGGHNMLEAAALKLPVVFGPYVFNFTEISNLLLESKAASRIENQKQLAETVCKWLTDEESRTEAGLRGFKVVMDNQGALQRLFAVVEKQLNRAL